MKPVIRISVIVLILSFFALSFSNTTYAQAGVIVTTKWQVNFRSGPGENYSSLGKIPPKTTLPAAGRDAANRWVQVNNNNVLGWLAVSLVTVNGDINTLPVVQAPTVQPTLTPTPKPTRTPAIRVGREFTTPKGILYVSRVKASKTFPENCVGAICQYSAKPGYILLVVYFKVRGKGSLDEIDNDLSASNAWAQSYLIANTDPATHWSPFVLVRLIGIQNSRRVDDLFLIFGVPEGARKFQLFWPNNSAPVNVTR